MSSTESKFRTSMEKNKMCHGIALFFSFSYFASLTLKAPNKKMQQTTFYFYFYLSKKIRLDFSGESSAKQRIHLKHQVLFSLKNNEKIFMNVVCCSHNWRFNG